MPAATSGEPRRARVMALAGPLRLDEADYGCDVWRYVVVVGENEKQVRRLVEESVNANRPEMLEVVVSRDVRVHPGTPGAAPDTEGIEELTVAFGRFHAAFPDLHIALDDVIAAGDRIAARWTATGTHRGELAGIPATGRAVRWGGIDVYRLDEGMIVEWWRNDDFVGLLHQLGRDPLRGSLVESDDA